MNPIALILPTLIAIAGMRWLIRRYARRQKRARLGRHFGEAYTDMKAGCEAAEGFAIQYHQAIGRLDRKPVV